MTRKELLSSRANDVVEVALRKGVCLGEAECLIVHETVLVELVRVEREMMEEISRLREALAELYALVKGECPSLLNEDSGGDAKLALEIEGLLKEEHP